jgi:competence protein ComEA
MEYCVNLIKHGVLMMKSMHLFSVLFALLAGVSLAASAAVPTAINAPKPVITQPAAVAGAQVALVNLNTADAATLQRELLGVGQVKAQAIVEYRAANGAFASVDDLLEVNGIGAAILEKNRSKLSVN